MNRYSKETPTPKHNAFFLSDKQLKSKKLQNLKNIDFNIIDKHLETQGIKPDEISALSSREKIIALYKEI